jgi:hypothetical protein
MIAKQIRSVVRSYTTVITSLSIFSEFVPLKSYTGSVSSDAIIRLAGQ